MIPVIARLITKHSGNLFAYGGAASVRVGSVAACRQFNTRPTARGQEQKFAGRQRIGLIRLSTEMLHRGAAPDRSGTVAMQ